jgi:putative endopeptidase
MTRKRLSLVRAAAVLGLVLCVASPLWSGSQDDAPRSSGVIKTHADESVRPQDDLFRHVNGKWVAEAEIPADRPADGAFYMLRDKSESDLRAIIEQTAAKEDNAAGSEAQKVGDLFKSFMDEEKIEALGKKPIEAEIAAIQALADMPSLLKKGAELSRTGVGGPFVLGVAPDAKQSQKTIVYVHQSGIGLPDESYYRDARFEPVRKAYLAHIEKMFELAGLPDPKGSADKIMALETRLAKDHWDRVRARDATKAYNKFDRAGLEKLTPGFDWSSYLRALQCPELTEVVVRQPSYLTAMAKALDDVPLEDWKTWLSWRLLTSRAPLLSKAFVDENFNFYSKTLSGTPEQRPRWKRGVAAVEGGLGEAVGKLYVEKHFPPAAKERMKALVANLIEAYRRDIEKLDWMSPETKQKALEKLAKFTPKIGYPDKWRDYSKLEIKPDDLVGNVSRAAEFERDRNLAKLGKPVDRTEWYMTPQTVNASYNPVQNEITFPAAILQPPFFDLNTDDAVNYGGIGAVIGHEIGHGFDDQGSKFDGDGNLKNWWTDADRAEFDKRGKVLVEQYNGFSPPQTPGQYVNGALTLGENIGDLGGLTVAYQAYQIGLGGKEAPVLEGLTGPQRFFTGWAQVWRSKYRDAEQLQRLATDPHSPPEFRCGVVRNLTEFYDAFGVKEGDKLWLPPEKRVRIW